MNFENYIETLADPDLPRSPQGYTTRQVSDWFIDDDGKIAVDYVLRAERISHDFEMMRMKENLRVALPTKKVNVSNKVDFREFYSDRTEAIVRLRHSRDIEMFGYDFK